MVIFWLLMASAIGWWTEVFWFSDRRPAQAPGAATRQPIGPAPSWLSPLGYGAIVAIPLLCLASLSGQMETAWLIVVSWVSRPSFVWPMIFFIFGFWASRYRSGLVLRGNTLFDAFLGKGEQSPWALQSIVAIIALVGIIIAVRPKLLDYMESFKAGEVEVKFAAASSTARQTYIHNLPSLLDDVDLTDWKDFDERFVGKTNSREQFTVSFDKYPSETDDVAKGRRYTRDIFLGNYIQPVAQYLYCLNLSGRESNALELLRPISADARHWISSLQRGYDGTDELKKLLQSTKNVIAQLRDSVSESGRWFEECFKEMEGGRKAAFDARVNADARVTNEDLKDITADIDLARKRCQPGVCNAPYKLVMIEPDVISALSSIISLTSGSAKKADFLTGVLSDYPPPGLNNYYNPGVVNLYYQLSDAKRRSEGWTLEGAILDVDTARKGVERFLDKLESPALVLPSDVIASKSSKEDIILGMKRSFHTNLYRLFTRYLELYVTKELGGEQLGEDSRQRWFQAQQALEDAYNKKRWFSVATPNLPGTQYRYFNESTWDPDDMNPDYRFDGLIALGLSAVILNENSGRAPPAACAAGRYYMAEASKLTDAYAEKAINDKAAVKNHIETYIQTAKARIDASCGG